MSRLIFMLQYFYGQLHLGSSGPALFVKVSICDVSVKNVVKHKICEVKTRFSKFFLFFYYEPKSGLWPSIECVDYDHQTRYICTSKIDQQHCLTRSFQIQTFGDQHRR